MVDWLSKRAESEGKDVLSWLDKEVLGSRDDGAVTLRSFDSLLTLHAGQSLIAERLSLSSSLSERARLGVVRRAIINAKKAGRCDAEKVLAEAARLEKDYLKKPIQAFVLLTSLTARYREDLTQVRPPGAVITFSRHAPKRFQISNETTLQLRSHGERFHRGGMVARVFVRDRDPTDAGEFAIDRLDLIRSIWNLHATTGRWRISSGPAKPVNLIRLGPVHTIHHVSGRPAFDGLWYEPEYDRAFGTFEIRNLEKLKQDERWIRSQIRSSPQYKQLERLLVRYGRALDETNLTNAFTQLWALLEDITATEARRYDVTIRRAAYIFRERKILRMRLDSIRRLRNRIVHDGADTDDAERIVYDLKRIVERHLLFFLARVSLFHTLDEYGIFLSQPGDDAVLKRRIEMLQVARKR